MKGAALTHAILAKFDAGGYPNAIARELGCSRPWVYTVLRKQRPQYKLELAKRRLADAKAGN